MSADVLTTAEVAALLDCEESTVQEKARVGELPGLKIGRSWVFPHGALMQSLNATALGHRERVSNERNQAEKLAVFDALTVKKRTQRPVLPELTP